MFPVVTDRIKIELLSLIYVTIIVCRLKNFRWLLKPIKK